MWPFAPEVSPFAKRYCQKVCVYINYHDFLHFRGAFGMHVAFQKAFAMDFEAMSPNIGNGALWGAFGRLRANMVCPQSLKDVFMNSITCVFMKIIMFVYMFGMFSGCTSAFNSVFLMFFVGWALSPRFVYDSFPIRARFV